MGPEPTSDTVPSAKQVVFLFMAATVVAVVVFLCGVLVGRGVPLGEGLTVSGSSVEGLGMDDLPPPTLSTASDEPSAAAGESANLTYYRRLSADEPEAETLRPATEDVVDTLASPAMASPAEDRRSSDPPPTMAADGDSPAPAGDVVRPSAAPPEAPEAGYLVQVAALRSLEAAKQVVSQLVAKGYPAAVVSPEPGAPVALFRVRIGPYSDRAEVQRIGRRLEAEEQFEPFVTR